MKRLTILAFALFLSVSAVADFRSFDALPRDVAMEERLRVIAKDILAEFEASGLREGHLSITVVDLRDPANPVRATHEGSIPYHPASVVKMFYMVALHDLVARGRISYDTPLRDAERDMIVDSSNDATAYVLDRITDTTGGPELHGRAWKRFVHKRNAVNRYLAALGYEVNANGKTWCEGPYGREMQLIGTDRSGRNRATTDAFAAMLLWIVQRRAVSANASEEMLALMKRSVPANDPGVRDPNVTGYTGERLPAGARLWSKPGFTSQVRHDAAYVELPGGRRYVLAVATRGASPDETLLPAIGERIARMFGEE